MKNKIEQELDQKEFENEIGRDLKLEYDDLDSRNKLMKGKNKYAIAAIHFFGTLVICYGVFLFVKFTINLLFGTAFDMLGVSFSWINPLIHGAILAVAVLSVFKKRSVLDDIFDWIVVRV